MFAFFDWLRAHLQLKRTLRRNAAHATTKMIEAIIAPVQQPKGHRLTEANRLHWVRHYLALGANPNARYLRVPALEPGMGSYPTLKKKRSVVSLALYYPSICQALVAAGADFDRSALEMAVLLANHPHFCKAHRPNEDATTYTCLGPSLDVLLEVKHPSARWSLPFVDLSDRTIKSAGELLAAHQPKLLAVMGHRQLQEATPAAPSIAVKPSRL